MGIKIKDIVDIIELNEEWKEKYNGIENNLYYTTSREKSVARERVRRDYEKWLDTEIGDTSSNTDSAVHADNMLILELLKDYLDKNPQIRFGQALVNLGIVQTLTNVGHYIGDYAMDPFYDKPEDILKRAQDRIRKEGENRA